MLLFILKNKVKKIKNKYFNTSHVTVYHDNSNRYLRFYVFQYISCYCLSTFLCYFRFLQLHFNTSHVTVYHHTTDILQNYIKDFNTSHVTVYLNRGVENLKFFRFQYISCYCLSQQTLERLWYLLDFNTSHVTVYQNLQGYKNLCHINFNTSHVTVYRLVHLLHPIVFSDFNTSHVTVYQMVMRQEH